MCPDEDPVKQPPGCPKTGNPVNIATGEKSQIETDYKGTGIFPLALVRTYANQRSTAPNAKFGNFWRNNYDRQVYVYQQDLTTAAVYRANGQRFNFTKTGVAWIGDPDVSDTLVELTDGNGNRTGWEYMTGDDVIETYNVNGQLILITNRIGITQSLLYDLNLSKGGDDNPETLDNVTDHFGRSITFTYDSTGRIATITDPNNEVYSYAYDSYGNLKSVSHPDDTPGNNADNPNRIYHYENTNYPYYLTGITDEAGQRFSTWGYDIEGRAILSEHAGGVERVVLAYNVDGTTTVTDSAGQLQTFHFQIHHGVSKVNQVDGGPCNSCGGQIESTSYDANGYKDLVTDFNGNVTHYDYDLRGLQMQRTEALGTVDQRKITTQWHINYRLPKKIDVYDKNDVLVKRTLYTYSQEGRLETTTIESP
jgi:YD repeat-containing protein